MMKFESHKKEFLLFLELERGYSPRTIQFYKSDLDQYSDFVYKNKIQFSNIDKDLIFDFHASLNSSVGPRSFSRMLSALRTFYKFLHTEGVIDDIVLNLSLIHI